MNGQTPLQRLDDAIHEFFTAIGDEGTLNGWVLSYQASFINDEGSDIEPIQWDAGYTISPGLSPFAALGLAEHVSTVIRDVYLGIHSAGDDE
jgi:hypothetical protein